MDKLAKILGVEQGDYKNKKIWETVAKDFLACAQVSGFKGGEILKVFVIDEMLWSPENSLLTAAQKLNRKAILAHYAEDVKGMYA